ncbi:MAG TPA: cyclodeaminase/cyclohydrolase family protein [Vicinamibacterales bacterium]|nr:cyclodeaminase/cyclohydrolase family protein [Vicinamibacterales bacterium]
MSLIDLPTRDLLTAFSSSDPTPGGGSAAALASAVGASLLMMVAALPNTRSGSDEDRAALAEAGGALADVRAQLTAAIDADAAAYDQVVAAYKLPKASAGEQGVRKAAIQQALRAATDVPLGVARLSAEALASASAIAAHGHRAAASDVGVAVALLRAGARGARLNVEINLDGLSDADYAKTAGAQIARLSEAAARAADEADVLLRD